MGIIDSISSIHIELLTFSITYSSVLTSFDFQGGLSILSIFSNLASSFSQNLFIIFLMFIVSVMIPALKNLIVGNLYSLFISVFKEPTSRFN